MTCCSLINALERGGQWQLAEKLFLQMCTAQVGRTWWLAGWMGGWVGASRVLECRCWGAACHRLAGAQQARGNALAVLRTLACFPPRPDPQGDEAPGSLLAPTPPGGSPATPAGKLARAQTSPSSVLDALQSPPGRTAGGLPHLVSFGVLLGGAGGHTITSSGRALTPFFCVWRQTANPPRRTPAGAALTPCTPLPPLAPCQMSIAESPRAQGEGGAAAGDHAWGPLSASFGILSATAAGRQDVLGGLGQAANGQVTRGQGQGADVDQLSGRFATALALERSGGSGGSGGSGSSGPADTSADPFAAAAHLVSSLRGASPTSERPRGAGLTRRGAPGRTMPAALCARLPHAPASPARRPAPCWPRPATLLCRAGSRTSFAIPENEEAAAPLEPASPAPPGLRRLGSGPGPAGAGGPGAGAWPPSPQRPASGLGRSGSLKRELGIPELEAAQSLRRAMSCYPELSGGEGQGQGEAAGEGARGAPGALPQPVRAPLQHRLA